MLILGFVTSDGMVDLRNLELGFCTLNAGDFIVLCSDGVHDNLDPAFLGTLLSIFLSGPSASGLSGV